MIRPGHYDLVGVAQLVEHPVVVRVVAGSIPVAHPTNFHRFFESMALSVTQSLIAWNALIGTPLKDSLDGALLWWSEPEVIANFDCDLARDIGASKGSLWWKPGSCISISFLGVERTLYREEIQRIIGKALSLLFTPTKCAGLPGIRK
jgi:hypothetical protein